LTMFRQGWIDKNMDVAFFLSAKSEKTTGDCALCQYIHEGKQGYRVFSYADGDKLYPHYDTITGKLNLFARKYSQFNESGKELKNYVEVWDDTYLYRFVQDKEGIKGVFNKVLTAFGLDGYKMVSQEKHGFPFIPIAYKRSKIGACWTPVQESIDAYELSVSQLCESNKVYAFPILFLKGTDIEIKAKMDGRPFAISSSDPESDARTINQSSASESFKLQLDTILKNIFTGSFTVTPPEVRSGDLPGVAIKLIYSPAVEKAMDDANEWNQFIDDTVRIFKYAYGIEKKMTSDFNLMDINGTIIPYVHQNVAEIVNNLCQEVLAGIKSVETASGQVPDGASDEYHRLLKQERDAIINEARNENNNAAKEAVAKTE
ncbi:MAG: phage portal protein, partial [Bacteroides sp.]